MPNYSSGGSKKEPPLQFPIGDIERAEGDAITIPEESNFGTFNPEVAENIGHPNEEGVEAMAPANNTPPRRRLFWELLSWITLRPQVYSSINESMEESPTVQTASNVEETQEESPCLPEDSHTVYSKMNRAAWAAYGKMVIVKEVVIEKLNLTWMHSRNAATMAWDYVYSEVARSFRRLNGTRADDNSEVDPNDDPTCQQLLVFLGCCFPPIPFCVGAIILCSTPYEHISSRKWGFLNLLLLAITLPYFIVHFIFNLIKTTQNFVSDGGIVNEFFPPADNKWTPIESVVFPDSFRLIPDLNFDRRILKLFNELSPSSLAGNESNRLEDTPSDILLKQPNSNDSKSFYSAIRLASFHAAAAHLRVSIDTTEGQENNAAQNDSALFLMCHSADAAEQLDAFQWSYLHRSERSVLDWHSPKERNKKDQSKKCTVGLLTLQPNLKIHFKKIKVETMK